MKVGDAVITLRDVKCTNPMSPEYGRIIPKGHIDIVVTINDKEIGIGLQSDKDPAGWFWSMSNFRILAESSEIDAVIRELELTLLN